VSERPIALRLSGVALCYRLAKQRIPSFKEYAISWLKGSLSYEELWALRGIDLVVSRGERVGIIGRNGAGKSTLLTVISGVLRPTRGEVEVSGRVAAILELGTGFDWELTGIENIFLNALLLGRTRAEIRERLESIVEFSELGDFIRSPIRSYSSGMIARLGFAVATAWVPEVLLLDEVFAVGDVRFLQRCQERLLALREQGTTMILVSHSPDVLEKSCDRAVWLDRGEVRADGSVSDVVASYLEGAAERSGVG